MPKAPSAKKSVLATGVFDVLHIEHLRFLAAAKKAGDYLMVGLETDTRVSHMKGHHRPVNPENIRLEQLSYVSSVDQVFLLPQQFDTQTDWHKFMRHCKPDIYAVSANTSWFENKQSICQKLGISLQVVHQFNPKYSTSKFLQKLKHEL